MVGERRGQGAGVVRHRTAGQLSGLRGVAQVLLGAVQRVVSWAGDFVAYGTPAKRTRDHRPIHDLRTDR